MSTASPTEDDLTRRVIPVMRRQGEGRIIQNSSILGLVAMPYRGAYNASKFALEGLSDTLRQELSGTGIHVVLIEPGPVLSRFRANALAAFRRHVDPTAGFHAGIYQAMLKRLEAEGAVAPFTLPPEAVLRQLVRALETRREAGRPLESVASVASFFLSRIDTKVDALLDGMIGDGVHTEEAKALRGKAAVTSAKLAYRMWSGLHLDERWRVLRAAGLGMECVSPGELRRVFELFPDIDRNEVLFTPNFGERNEYVEAFSAGVRVTVDSLYPLQFWPEVFEGRDIFVRMDLGEGSGHHQHVHTAGVRSKFGIGLEDLEGLAAGADGYLYAINSHSRTITGERRKSRERLVRLRIEGELRKLAQAVEQSSESIVITNTKAEIDAAVPATIGAAMLVPESSK